MTCAKSTDPEKRAEGQDLSAINVDVGHGTCWRLTNAGWLTKKHAYRDSDYSKPQAL